MKNPAFKNGLILGLCLIVYTLLIYLVSPAFFLAGLGMTSSLISILIYILFMVKTGNEVKKANNGYASFSEVFIPIFICALIGGTIAIFFNYILNTVIDPDLPNFLKETMISNFENASWIPDEAKEEAITQMEDDQSFEPSLGNSVYGFLMGSVVGLVISLIIAAIIKKEHPNDILA